MTPVKACLLAVLLTACTAGPANLPDSATVAPNAFGPTLDAAADPAVSAATLAQDAFADSARTYGRPAEAARAAAALDYLAGEITTNPRWATIDAATKSDLIEARKDLRAAIGTAPTATSQQIVDSLTAAATALAADNQEAALHALTTPAFPTGPQKTLAVLNNLPYLQSVNVATQLLANQITTDNSGPGL